MPNIQDIILYLQTTGFDSFKYYLREDRPYFLGVLIVFALINCFFGYSLRKIWNMLLGIVLGAGIGFAVAYYMDLDSMITLAVTGAGAILCGIIAYLLYRVGVFFLIFGLVLGTLYTQAHMMDRFSWMLALIFALILATLSFPIERIHVVLVTSACGAVLTLYSIQELITVSDMRVVYVSMGLLFLLGFLTQARPGGKNSLFRDITGDSLKKSRRTREDDEDDEFFERLAQQSGKVSQDTTYDFQFVPEEESRRTKAIGPVPELAQEYSPFGPDLSDARESISKDIQEFYEETQKENLNQQDSDLYQ